jgi:6-pyruvoyltetrahydropterin/6-carboxytetrahydropterin synthase
MIIRKSFKFENAHIVRKCTTERCRESIHGHSYRVEVLLQSDYLDNGQMVFDFGLMKLEIRDIIDSFDHSVSIWSRDDPSYVLAIKEHSQRWIILPVSPSAEQLSRVFFILIDRYLKLNQSVNGEKNVTLQSIIIHETDSGYAQCFKEDAYNIKMGEIDIEKIIFSDDIKNDWRDANLQKKLIFGLGFLNPINL